MMRSLGVTSALRWFLVAIVALAIWRGFEGDLGAIATTLWSWIERGAEVVTMIWNEIQPK